MSLEQRLPEPLRTLGLSIEDCVRLGPLGRTTLYGAIKRGELKSRVVCGRRIVMADDFEAFLRGEVAA